MRVTTECIESRGQRVRVSPHVVASSPKALLDDDGDDSSDTARGCVRPWMADDVRQNLPRHLLGLAAIAERSERNAIHTGGVTVDEPRDGLGFATDRLVQRALVSACMLVDHAVCGTREARPFIPASREKGHVFLGTYDALAETLRRGGRVHRGCQMLDALRATDISTL